MGPSTATATCFVFNSTKCSKPLLETTLPLSSLQAAPGAVTALQESVTPPLGAARTTSVPTHPKALAHRAVLGSAMLKATANPQARSAMLGCQQ